MTSVRPVRLDRPVDPARDHVIGTPDAPLTLVEYGSYVCAHCHAAHEVISDLRDRFGDRMRYVFRHLPRPGDEATHAAALAEVADAASGQFWEVHDTLMQRGPSFAPGELDGVAADFGLPARDDAGAAEWEAATARVRDDEESARRSGALATPTFFINGRRYEGPWDETSLAEAMQASLGRRLHAASVDFARWGPSTGLLLLAATVLAVVLSNSPVGPAFEALWRLPLGVGLGDGAFMLPLLDWINHGLLSLFFLVVGLEIKHEFTVGRLATRRAAALPIAASFGGIIVPALLYLLVVGTGPLGVGWGITIGTDTAFAVAIIVFLGRRVPVELRVFLTAAVIVDDIVAIAVVALFYSGALSLGWLAASAVVTGLLAVLNRSGVYRLLPYAALGVVLWVCLHEAGLHATLAGVILAVMTPTRPPPNLRALMSQAQAVLQLDARIGGVMRHGPSEPALRALETIHDRIQAPASTMLRAVEPWSNYAVLPIFALANAGVVWDAEVVGSHGPLMLAILAGLVVGKPVGIVGASWLVVRLGIATKPAAYTWRQVVGAGALAGIGFTMSLFIAAQAFDGADFAAAKIAIFAASLIAGAVGALILWPQAVPDETDDGSTDEGERLSPVDPPLQAA